MSVRRRAPHRFPELTHDMEAARDVLALRMRPGLGDIGVARARERYGSARRALEQGTFGDRAAAYAAADAVLQDAAGNGIDVASVADTFYPERLRDLSDPPAVVFHRGPLAMADAPAVAIVGTRQASPYGLRVARGIASACARAGVCVVSGLAAGIDGAAHEAALAAGGRTVAVLGTGVDVVYPRRHRALQDAIATQGAVISEILPGEPGHSGAFPRRNRIIAALADVTVVVEAGEGSGALITADVAHALDRRIACVPNAIDVPSARGSNALLKAFAEPILHPEDVLALLDLRAQPTPAPLLDGDAATCWDAIQHGTRSLPDIIARSRLSARAVSAAITALELEGLVIVDFSGAIMPSPDVAHIAGVAPA